MADNRFPLFRLPFLALCKVLDFYGPHEIIQLSICSKRSLRVAKRCWKKNGNIVAGLSADRGLTVNLKFFDSGFCYWFVVSEAQEDIHNQQTHNVRIGDAVVPSIHKKTETVTYWEDRIFGIEQVVRHINDLFNLPITSIHSNSEGYKNEFIDTMDCIMKVQESVQECTVRSNDFTDEHLTHLLDNCKITEKFRIHGGPTRKFKNDWSIRSNCFHISFGSCITLQNLANIDCQLLSIGHSNLTSGDMNQFLKHWQNGGNSRIRYARIKMKSINHDIIKSGIEIVPQPVTLIRLFRSYSSMSNNVELKRGGFNIQRNDGTTGAYFLSKYLFEFGVDPIDGFI